MRIEQNAHIHHHSWSPHSNFRNHNGVDLQSLAKIAALIMIISCSPSEPLVISRSGEPMRYSTVIASGNRDGYYLEANLSIFAPDVITVLQLKMRIEIAVPSKFIKGEWEMGGQAGPIKADWLNFLGGQGGPPVISGRFRLMDINPDSVAIYTVNLPRTEIKQTSLLP